MYFYVSYKKNMAGIPMLIVTENYDKVKKMMDESPDLIHMPDRYGRMPMYYAIEFQRTRMARLLLSYEFSGTIITWCISEREYRIL